MTREEDVARKVEEVRNYIRERNKKGAVLSLIENFAWITSGARSYVALTDSVGAAWALITTDESYILTKNIETTRMKNEELPSNFKIVEFDWFTDPKESIKKIVDDQNILYEEDPQFANFLFNSRIKLSEYEIQRYAEVGEKSAIALEKAMLEIKPEMTEIQVKGIIENEVAAQGLDSLLVLVFGDESRRKYRHNLPREVKIGKRCFASICAKKYGLVISSTRTVEFGKDSQFESQYFKNMEVEAGILDATYRMSSLGQVFFEIEKGYASHGYPDEWKLHHQGGIAGYKTRELVAIPHMPFEITDGMAFAWNPTITGTKLEDTYVKLENGMKLLSFYPKSNWPYKEININGRIYRRPDILKL
ncbi:MAG: M24 family metallopeptidase [Athalassotoga sp.]|uniref:M24 family metallopeptidase n=1 Tax=Athalassotoga sp. TaxID=2022597 RepID=UPI003D068C97